MILSEVFSQFFFVQFFSPVQVFEDEQVEGKIGQNCCDIRKLKNV